MLVETRAVPIESNDIPAPIPVVLTDEKGKKHPGEQWAEPGQVFNLGAALLPTESGGNIKSPHTHVVIETADGNHLLFRRKPDGSLDIASTQLASSGNPRRDIEPSMLEGVEIEVGKPFALKPSPEGERLKTRESVVAVTAFNTEGTQGANGVESDLVQVFGRAMHQARQGAPGDRSGELTTPELPRATTVLGVGAVELSQFHDNPVEALAHDRLNLFSISTDESLPPAERKQKLNEAVDEYFDKIIALDSLIPETGDTAQKGVPEYIPNGFMELGTLDSLNPSERYNREINFVDKRAMLGRYKELFMRVYSMNPTGTPQERVDMTIAHMVAKEIFTKLPYARDDSYKPAERGGVLKLSETKTGLCQQQALTSQVLLQAFGIEARLSKNAVAGADEIAKKGPEAAYGGDHVSNFIKIGEKWYVFDATNHNTDLSNGPGKFAAGIFEIPEAPDPTRKQEFVLHTNRGLRKYTTRQEMYWAVKRLPAVA
jgi:hypothetical protein